MSPYRNLAANAYWKTGVEGLDPRSFPALYKKKFAISPTDRIVTAGSCFAQHIARVLKGKGYRLVDVEPAPPGMSQTTAERFGYGLYSARYGNIYSIRQLLQLLQETKGGTPRSESIWERNGRYFDALRPGVEPEGLESPEEVQAHRARHLKAVRRLMVGMDVFVFTFGLTEAWVHRESGTVYPTAPGTIAGEFDPDKFEFKNFTFNEVYADFIAVRRALRRRNANLRFLVTVSPVPLTATASGDHVLAATVHSKSVLRAVAGELSKEFEDVDYFPSYELIAAHPSKGAFYERNLRSVAPWGVDAAMNLFMSEHNDQGAMAPTAPRRRPRMDDDDDEADRVICEEVVLEAYAP